MPWTSLTRNGLGVNLELHLDTAKAYGNLSPGAEILIETPCGRADDAPRHVGAGEGYDITRIRAALLTWATVFGTFRYRCCTPLHVLGSISSKALFYNAGHD